MSYAQDIRCINLTKNIGFMKILSPVFNNEEYIPSKFTCEGKDINPPLLIENIPAETESVALIVEDPDAPMGLWIHWVMWNIVPKGKMIEIEENSTPSDAIVGINSWERNEYGGPCPPDGEHRYFFKAYALSEKLETKSNSDREELLDDMIGKIIQKDEIIGLYSKD